MFERGDKIIYKEDNIFYDLTKGKTYIAKSCNHINYIGSNKQLIQVVDNNNRFTWVSEDYFEMDLLEQRKKKINKIKERICG